MAYRWEPSRIAMAPTTRVVPFQKMMEKMMGKGMTVMEKYFANI
jgi:hypothetical protein